VNHYPHHIGDFNNATRHLTRVERSLYRDLMDLYYDTEQPLPAADFDKLARRLCCDETDRPALRDVLNEFFLLDGDVYRHDRCDREIARYHSQIDTARKAGKASAARRANDRSTTVAVPLHQPEPEPEPEPIREKRLAAAKKTRAAKRCPVDFKVTPEATRAMELECPGVDLEAETRNFRDWEFKDPRSDWQAAWRRWMRKAFKDLADKPSGETNYAREMRQKYEQVAPLVAAKPPGAVRANPMDVIEGMTREQLRIAR
jgi:uncharacterized protein YdaU (DUF1376 family)